MEKIAGPDHPRVRIHAFVISWKGMQHRASRIADAVFEFADEDDSVETGSGHWIQVPNEWFYGRKFEECLRQHTSGVMLQIQADASSSDWGAVVEKCRETYRDQPNVGVWAPNVDFNAWVTERVSIRRVISAETVAVANTDGVLWSMSEAVVRRLSELAYDVNNMGWGVEWAAIAYSMANNLLVLRDLSITILHPKGSGYGRQAAGAQMDAFFAQLTVQESIQLDLLRKYCHPDGLLHNATAKGLLRALAKRMARYPYSVASRFGIQ
jgi:hypothetical protein